MHKFMDYYSILSIDEDSSKHEIKQAFRNLAKEWHPDAKKHSREEATRKFAEISTAYEILNDPEKSRKYDYYRKYSSSASNSNGSNEFKDHSFEKEWVDLSKWFQEIYEEHLRNIHKKANIFLSKIRRGLIGAAIGLAIGILFRSIAIPLMILGWFFGYYLIKDGK